MFVLIFSDLFRSWPFTCIMDSFVRAENGTTYLFKKKNRMCFCDSNLAHELANFKFKIRFICGS